MKVIPSLSHGVPFITLICFMFLGSSLQIGGFPVLPTFFLAPLYYWVLFRPNDIPLWSAWILGLIYDALLGNPLWVSPFLLMISWVGSQYLRPLVVSYKFPLIWSIFGAYSFIYISLYSFCTGGGLILFASWIYGMCLYPLISCFLSFVHVRLRTPL